MTIEPEKPRLCIDARFLNLWMVDTPFSLETLVGVPRFVYPNSCMSKYTLEMRSRLEIIWYGFFYSISVSHVGIVVMVGKLVWVRMGKVGGLIFGMIAGAVWGDSPITKC